MAGMPGRALRYRDELNAVKKQLASKQRRTKRATQHKLQAGIVAILQAQGLSAEQTWQQLAEYITHHAGDLEEQWPASAWKKLVDCARMQLLVQVANKKTGGESQTQELQRFQALMQTVFDEKPATPAGRNGQRAAPVVAQEEDEENEDEDDD